MAIFGTSLRYNFLDPLLSHVIPDLIWDLQERVDLTQRMRAE